MEESNDQEPSFSHKSGEESPDNDANELGKVISSLPNSESEENINSSRKGCIENNESFIPSPENGISNRFIRLTKPATEFGYSRAVLYGKCEIRDCNFKPIRFTNGNMVQRPPGTTFRIGYEVFLCSHNRPNALGKTFLFLGVFDSHMKNAQRSPVLLLDTHAFELQQLFGSEVNDIDTSNLIFRTAPLHFVAKVPGGKELDDTMVEMIDKAGEYSKSFFSAFEENGRNLADLDFIENKVPTKRSGRINTNAKKLSLQGSLICNQNKMQSTPNSVTASELERVAEKVSHQVISHLKKVTENLAKESAKTTKIMVENKSLKLENTSLKGKVKALEEEVKELKLAQLKGKEDMMQSQEYTQQMHNNKLPAMPNTKPRGFRLPGKRQAEITFRQDDLDGDYAIESPPLGFVHESQYPKPTLGHAVLSRTPMKPKHMYYELESPSSDHNHYMHQPSLHKYQKRDHSHYGEREPVRGPYVVKYVRR